MPPGVDPEPSASPALPRCPTASIQVAANADVVSLKPGEAGARPQLLPAGDEDVEHDREVYGRSRGVSRVKHRNQQGIRIACRMIGPSARLRITQFSIGGRFAETGPWRLPEAERRSSSSCRLMRSNPGFRLRLLLAILNWPVSSPPGRRCQSMSGRRCWRLSRASNRGRDLAFRNREGRRWRALADEIETTLSRSLRPVNRRFGPRPF